MWIFVKFWWFWQKRGQIFVGFFYFDEIDDDKQNTFVLVFIWDEHEKEDKQNTFVEFVVMIMITTRW